MNTFEIFLIIELFAIFFVLLLFVYAFIKKTKTESTRAAILSHRELWLYYLNDPELKNLLSNNNGGGIDNKIDPKNLSENQYRFLVLFLNHMESMLPSWKKYEKDWVGLFKNPALRKVYENTKLYRNKKFCKLIDKIIDGYDK